MKTLPALKNCEICPFLIEFVSSCTEMYKTDVAYDIKQLYTIVLRGFSEVFWGIRKLGTQMGTEKSPYLDFYKKQNAIVIFKLSNLKIIDGEIFGDISLTSYTEEYENEYLNINNNLIRYYDVEESEDFYRKSKKIIREFLNKDEE